MIHLRIPYILFIAALFICLSCTNTPTDPLTYCDAQIRKTLLELGNGDRFPRNIDKDSGNWQTTGIHDWTSGFWPGILWYDYEYTNDEAIKEAAVHYTELLEPLSTTSGDHDIGFQIMCSYGNAYRLTHNKKYRDVIHNAARRLSLLYNPTVGTTLSWPWMVKEMNWPHNTIMDNMMNLELLFWSAKNGGGQTLLRHGSFACYCYHE